MAGVTNVAFRTLCRELELSRAGTVSGLYVCEMVTARALVERHPVTMHMTTFAPDESPRSLQLYTVDPENTYAAAKMIVDEDLAQYPEIWAAGGTPHTVFPLTFDELVRLTGGTVSKVE